MIDVPAKEQLSAWAVARSLETVSIELQKYMPAVQLLSARIITNSTIGLTFGNEIVFTNQNYYILRKMDSLFPKLFLFAVIQ